MSNTAKSARPLILSQGEPNGIGPEIALKAFAALDGAIGGRRLILAGSLARFHDAAAILGLRGADFAGHVVDTGPVAGRFGGPDPANAAIVAAAIRYGVEEQMAGRAGGLVTAPIQKSAMTGGGFAFPGHTEYLAHLTGRSRAVMMLASEEIDPPLRVVPFTIHLPLKDMFAHLKPDDILATALIVIEALGREFGCARPRLAVAGINPHAGEDGTMGREDDEILAPLVTRLRAMGHDVLGPLPADTLFHDAARRSYDAVLSMYHDQALIPIKTLAFWSGVNITLGLPIVRTSPDHGTALELAGTGRADAQSMIAAIRVAAAMADRRAP